MKQPENEKELQSFLGLCQYLMKFTPELANLSEPLRFLTRKNIPYTWTQERTEAFKQVKAVLTEDHKLMHFDTHNKIYLWRFVKLVLLKVP